MIIIIIILIINIIVSASFAASTAGFGRSSCMHIWAAVIISKPLSFRQPVGDVVATA